MAPKNKDNKDKRESEDRSKSDSEVLAKVLQAVTDLKQSNGCTTDEIVTQVKTTVRTSPRGGSDGLTEKIRRALEHAVYVGLLKQIDGKYAIVDDDESRHRERDRDQNQKRGKRRRSSTRSSSRSTEGDYTDGTENDDQSSYDGSSCDRSESRKSEKRTKSNQKVNQKKKGSKDRSICISPSKGRSRNRSERKNTSKAKGKTPNPDDPSTQHLNEDDLPRTPYSYGSHKRLKRFNRDLRHQQMDEEVMCDDQNNDENTPACGNPDCLCNSNEEPRKPSETRLPLPDPDSDPESEPDPEVEIIDEVD